MLNNAGIAQLVERNLAKVDVAGSSPVSRSAIRHFSRDLFEHAPLPFEIEGNGVFVGCSFFFKSPVSILVLSAPHPPSAGKSGKGERCSGSMC